MKSPVHLVPNNAFNETVTQIKSRFGHDVISTSKFAEEDDIDLSIMRTEECNSKYSRDDDLREFALGCSTLLCSGDSKEKDKFADTVEEIWTKLEKFIDLGDAIRSQDNLVTHTALEELREKSKEIENYFEIIDKIEVFVNMVKGQVSRAEAAVNKAEADLKNSQFKKAISFLAILPNRRNVRPSFEPFPILETDKYFPLIIRNKEESVEKGQSDDG